MPHTPFCRLLPFVLYKRPRPFSHENGEDGSMPLPEESRPHRGACPAPLQTSCLKTGPPPRRFSPDFGRTSGSRYILYDRFSALFGNRCCRNHLDKQCTRKQQRSRDTSHCNSRDTYRTRSHTGRYRYHVFCPPTHRIYFYRLARRRYARIGDCHTDDCLSTGRWPANHSCRSITRTRSSKTDGMDRFHQLFYSQPSRLLLFCIPMSGRCTGSLVGLSRGTQLRCPAFLLAIPSEQQT